MWYFTCRKFKPELYDENLDKLLESDRTSTSQPPISWDVDRGVFEARVHGTSVVDAGTICWHDGTERKRAENAYYHDEMPLEAKHYFQLMPRALELNEGWYIVDCDDPELVEHGEEYIHERLTSHLGDMVGQPETWSKAMPDVYDYVFNIAFNHLANGELPPTLIHEILRQRLGYPYEWIGAVVD